MYQPSSLGGRSHQHQPPQLVHVLPKLLDGLSTSVHRSQGFRLQLDVASTHGCHPGSCRPCQSLYMTAHKNSNDSPIGDAGTPAQQCRRTSSYWCVCCRALS